MADFEQAKEALLEFLKSDERGQCLILKGRWGSGKTYLWKECEAVALVLGWLKKPAHYISLFGLSSVDDVSSRIRDNKVKNLDPFYDPQNQIRLEDIAALVPPKFSRANKIGIKTIRTLKNRVQAKSADGRVFCFDDLDRIENDVGAKDRLFGHINFLKNECGCKIILIVNDEACDHREHFEKVGDQQIQLNSAPERAVDIVFGKSGSWDFLREMARRLEIDNLRNLIRIKHYSESFEHDKSLSDTSPTIVKHSIFSGIALAIKCLTDRSFIHATDAIRLLDDDTISNYRNMSGAVGFLNGDADANPRPILEGHFLGKVTELLGDRATLPIFRGAFQYVCEGFIEKDKFRELVRLAVDEHDSKEKYGKATKNYFDWWSNTYHGSIQADGALAMASLSSSLDELANVDFANVGLGDLNSSIVMLREHGADSSADSVCEALKVFLKTNKGKEYLQDKLRLWGASSVTDPAFQKIINELSSKSLEEIEHTDLIWQIFEGKETSEYWRRINLIPESDIRLCLAQEANPKSGERINIQQRIEKLLFFPESRPAVNDFATEMLKAFDALAQDSFARERIERFGAEKLKQIIEMYNFPPRNLFTDRQHTP